MNFAINMNAFFDIWREKIRRKNCAAKKQKESGSDSLYKSFCSMQSEITSVVWLVSN